MGTLSRDTFSQPRKSKKIGQFAMTGGFAFESLCFQFTRGSYMTFFSSFVRTKLYCVSIVKTTRCVQRLFHYSWRQNGKTSAVKNPRIRKLNWVRLNWPPPNRHLWLLDSTDYSYRHWFLLCLVFANQCKLFFSIVQDSALHLSCIPCPRVTQGCRSCQTECVQLLLDTRTMSYNTQEGLFTRAVFLLDHHISTYPFLLILHTYRNGRDFRKLCEENFPNSFKLVLLDWSTIIKRATYFLEVGKRELWSVELPDGDAF